MSEQDGAQSSTKPRRSRKTNANNQENGGQVSVAQRPANDDKVAWKSYWEAQGQSWRTEPEIDEERQKYLDKHRSIMPDIERGIFPFKDETLSRADIEWLLVTHENGQGPVDWSNMSQHGRKGLDLRGAYLRNIDLSKLPLSSIQCGLNWNECLRVTLVLRELAAVHLEGTDLSEAHLEGANLEAGHLERANLSEANLKNCWLRGAHMQEINLSNTFLERTNLGEAHLEGAHLHNSRLNGTNLMRAHLEGANLAEARLEGANFREAIMKKANFGWATLNKVNLSRTHLEDANLSGATFEEVSLNEAHLERANLSGAHLVGVNLIRAHLNEAFLNGTHFEGAFFGEVYMKKAHLSGAYLGNAKFNKTHLEEADLSGAYLIGAKLNDVHLEGAQLAETHWEGAHLKQVHMNGANLLHASFDAMSKLEVVILGGGAFGFASLADVLWGNTDLTRLNWLQMKKLGDDCLANQKLASDGTVKISKKRESEYEVAVRANRQLAFVLQVQGLNEIAARFTYRAQLMQRKVFWYQRNFLQYFFSLFLELLAGYGYKPLRSFIAYLIVILGFAISYYIIGRTVGPAISPLGSFVFSMTSFHGRGFFPGGIGLDDPLTVLAALEALVGLLIEVTFIATLTRRLFGK